MASLKSGTTIGTYTAIHTNNISTYALTSIPATISPTNIYIGNAIYFGGANNYFNWDGARINSNVGIQSAVDMRAPIFYDSNDTNYYVDPNSTSVLNRVYTTGRLEVTYNTDRYQMNFLRNSGSNWWVTNDSGNLGLHVNNVGDRFYFSTGGDFYSDSNGWLSTALAAKQNASTAITTSNIGSQSVSYASSAGNADTTDGLHVHGGRNNEADKIVRTDSNGYIQAGWINTTSGDRASTVPNRFYGSDDDYIRYYDRPHTQMYLGLTYHYSTARRQHTTDTNYWVGTMGWGQTDWNSVGQWGSGFVDSWSNPANKPPAGGHHVGVQSFHYRNGSTAYGWQLAQGEGTGWYLRRIWGGGWSGWYEMITSENIGSQSVSYASSAGNADTVGGRSVGNGKGNVGYFDSNGNLYINNPESYSGEVRLGAAWSYGGVYASGVLSLSTSSSNIYFVFNNSIPISMGSDASITLSGSTNTPVNITGSAHKYLTINPGNGYEAMVRYIGGSGSSWYVGKRTSSQLIGTESFHFYSEAAGATVGGINPSGDMIVTGSMRAPIFYDSINTAYYLDPNSSTSGYFAGTLRQNDGKYVRDSSYRTISGYSDYYSGGDAGWYRVAEITLTSNCTGAVLYGTLYDHRYDGADAYQISIVARAECDFTSNNESHYINVGCTILGSTAFSSYQSKIRVLLVASSSNSRTYEVQFYETNWNHDTWQLETTGWTVYSSPQAPRSSTGTARVNYISNQNADYQRANAATYSPIYYDSQDTGYYVDPNSTSKLVQVNLGTVNTRLISDSGVGYLKIYGSASNFLGVGPYDNNGWVYFENSGNANGIYFNSPGRYAFDSVDVTPYTDNENSLGNGSYRWANVYTSGWFRNYGAQGIYNESYGTHFYSNGGASWAITGSGGNVELQFRSNHQSTIRGYVYADTSNQIGFLNNGGSWAFRTTSNNSALVHGTDLTINADGAGSSNIIMNDGDEGSRIIHCNSNRIGFLNQSASWGSYCNDDGSWATGVAMYSPIYYDSDDTAFYVDPNSSSRVRNLYVGDSGSNWVDTGGWGTQFHVSNGPHSILKVFARNEGIETGLFSHVGGQSKVGSFSNHDFSVVRNWDNRMTFYSGYTYANGYLQAADSLRAPIFYDSNDTNYYVDPNGNSVLTTATFNVNASSTIAITSAGTNASMIKAGAGDELYLGGNDTWQMRFNGGNVLMDNGGYLQNNQSLRAPIFYDSQDTGYYVDPNSVSVLADARSYRFRNINAVTTDDNFGLYFGASDGTAYAIYRESGSWAHPYPDLRIAFHTGIKLGANASYEGIRFYTDYDMATQVMSVNNGSDPLGGGNVYVNNSLQAGNSLRAPIFYDSNDTGYYGNFAGFSRLSEAGITNTYTYNYDSVESSRSTAEFGNVGKYVATRNGVGDYPSFSYEHVYGTHSWGQIARFHIRQSGADRPSIQFSSGSSNTRWNIGYCTGSDDNFRISQNMGYRPDNSGTSDGWGTPRLIMDTNGIVDVPQGYISNGNPWGTSNSAFFPNGITTAGGTNWIYGFTYIGNAPANGNGHEFNANGTQYSTASITTPTFIVNSHSDNTRGYRIHNTSGTAVSAMFVNSSNQLVIAAGAVDQVNLNKKVYVNGVALGVNVTPSATAGRIDASNDIVAYSSSDERLKENITPIENALDKVKSLTGVEFDWKPEYKHAHGYEGHDTGIIAQQVEAVMPSAVRTNDTGFLAVRYEKLIGLLIEGMKEQQAQIDELKAKLDGLTK